MYARIVADEILFDWDEANISHLGRHNIMRPEAEQVVLNASVEIGYQVIEGEERYVIAGRTNGARFLTLVFANRRGAVRVITGWDSTAEEEGEYWKGV